jgi:hypothetical protein
MHQVDGSSKVGGARFITGECLYSSLQPSGASRIPQPEGWGSFIPAYIRTAERLPRIPQTGRLGIVHSSLCSHDYGFRPLLDVRQGFGNSI